jgi:hypothetical protein
MIRQAIEDLCRRQPVSQREFPEVVGNPNLRTHANLHFRSAFASGGLPAGATRQKMRSHDRIVTHATNSSQAQMVNELLKKCALAAAYRMC